MRPEAVATWSCHNGGVDVSGMRPVQARVARLGRDEQAAVSFAIVEALRPLAELGDQFVAPADAGRLLAGARSASPEVLRQVLAEAEARRSCSLAKRAR